MIAKMAKVRVVPVVYQGPVTLKDLFKRKKVVIRFGEPIDVSDIKKLNAEGLQLVEERVQGAFDNLDKAIDPTFKYQIK